ncbi:MAG: diacylglycerol kinase family lipid kinase [Armatimonadota bacterium]|nr:diacylglycerol kinase family lipid kinase [Armatimonadota bacterium]
MSTVLIYNPTAGRSHSRLFRRGLEQAIREHGLECEIKSTAKPGDATIFARQAAEKGAKLIIAAGGDGTINEVVTGMAGSGSTLGILPLGTVNVLARELGIPLKINKAVKTILQGHVKNIDIGVANSRCFVLMAGFGFDAEVVANIVQPLKDLIGATAYVLKGLETLARYKATKFTLEMPDNRYSGLAYVVVVANSPTYTYKLKIAPYGSHDDGLLDVLVFEQPVTFKLGFLRQILELFMQKHVYNKNIRYFKTTSVIVRSEPDTMVQLDGDSFGKTPVAVSISPHALPVLVP